MSSRGHGRIQASRSSASAHLDPDGAGAESVAAVEGEFAAAGDGDGLPILSLPENGTGAEDAVAFLESLQLSKEAWTQRLYKLKMSADGEAVLVLAGETPVYWGEALSNLAEVEPKARRLQRVLDAPESAGGLDSVRFIDDRRVVIKPRRPVSKKETHG